MKKHLLITCLAILAYIGLSQSAYPLQDAKHPLIDKVDQEYLAPVDLNEVPLEDLLEYQKTFHRKLMSLNDTMGKQKSPELIAALHAYDTNRLKIVEVIPMLIEEHSLTGDVKKQLLTYAETFAEIRSDYEKLEKESWEDYKSYDFRVGIAYQALMYMFSQDAQLYKTLQANMHDKNTVMGAYADELNTAYAKVEAIHASQPEYSLVRQLQNELARLHDEIRQR